MPTLVCLPGLLCPPSVFAPMLQAMGATDARIHEAPLDPSFEAIVDESARRLAGKSILVGHSMGSYLALAIARRVPERLAGLVLISTNAAADTEKGAALRGKVSAWAAKVGMEALGDSLADTMLAPSRRDDAALRTRLRDMSAAYGLEAFRAHQVALAGRPDQTAGLADVTCPVLVLCGADDTVTPPEYGRAVADGVARGRFQLLDGVGHMPPLECPDLLALHIRDFLADLEKERAA